MADRTGPRRADGSARAIPGPQAWRRGQSRQQMAARQAARILADGNDEIDCHWIVHFYLVRSKPGEIRLTPAGGYPHGAVPVEFQRLWWEAVAHCALREIYSLSHPVAPDPR